IFFAAFFLGGLATMRRAAPRMLDPRARDELRATAAGLVGCGALFAVNDALYTLPVMLAFFAAMGLGVGLATLGAPGPRPSWRFLRERQPL
ncbi:MAG: hypothetical protein KC620_25195, partial [Myxococcales bacterium]|nr:hypothetical protein [Myxococcales bacterium]